MPKTITHPTKISEKTIDVTEDIIEHIPNTLSKLELDLMCFYLINGGKHSARKAYIAIGKWIVKEALVHFRELDKLTYAKVKFIYKDAERSNIEREIDADELRGYFISAETDKEFEAVFSAVRARKKIPAYNSIQKALKNLEGKGFLENEGNGKSNYYVTREFDKVWNKHRTKLINAIKEKQKDGKDAWYAISELGLREIDLDFFNIKPTAKLS